MKILSTIKGKVDDLFRVAVAEGDDLRKRAVKQQAILDDYRHTPAFGILLDHFDGELRAIMRQFFNAPTEADALQVWHDARAFMRMQERVEKGVNAKARGVAFEEAYIARQAELMKVDQMHARQNLDAQGRLAQTGR